MTKLILIISLWLLSISSFSQTLFDIFLKLPEHVAIETISKRKQMIARYIEGEQYVDTKKRIYLYLDVVDHRNGYMSYAGAYEGTWSMCYWNLENDTKLVAVLCVGCGPLCVVESFDFFTYDGTELKPYRQPVIENIKIEHFFSLSNEEFIMMNQKYDLPLGLVFELPRYDKNIVANIYTECNHEGSDYTNFLKPKQLGNTIILQFQQDGSFKKTDPYWDKKRR
ncbi:hypothetical protein E9993_07460 [Labilibacter sediminis]|nr:hypothetical protein E9993_07460 [Labilibacter sediminis]